MGNFDFESSVYIVCPAGLQTGGTELCHQLVDYLNKRGRTAYIVYINQNYELVDAEVPVGFCEYKINVTINIVDTENTIIVLPETLLHLCNKYKWDQTKFVFWWMSLDNYFPISGLTDYLKFEKLTVRGVATRVKQLIVKKNEPLTFSKIREMESRSLNVYQSSYVNHFLLNQRIYNQLPLSDYINVDFINSKRERIAKENIVLFNPTKGFETTKRIIASMKGYVFIPLVNLNRNEVQDLFTKAKLYIDFGNHPGKDRIPREAIINDCCIIVGKNGSAKYFQDVPIKAEYKFDNEDQENICAKIDSVLRNYDTCIDDFKYLKEAILKEKVIFEEEINTVFSKFFS